MSNSNITHVPATGGSIQKVVGCTHRTLITHATSGVFSTILAEVPVNCGPPLHHHEQDAEWAFILQGQITFEGTDGAVVAGPGDSVWLPAGRAHAFRNTGADTARMLIVITPGVQAHAFFSEVDAALRGALVPPVMVQIASRHGIQFAPPPAAAA